MRLPTRPRPTRCPPRRNDRAFGCCLAFSRLSSSLLPSPRCPKWTAPRPIPAGTAGVIPPGKGRLFVPKLVAHRKMPGASGRYWFVNVRSGSISPPGVPGIRGGPLPRFPVWRRPLLGKYVPRSREMCFWMWAWEPRVSHPVLQTQPSRGAMLARWEGWRPAFL